MNYLLLKYQKIVQLARELDTDLISVKRSSEPLGMMCQIKQGLIYDCWGNQYDVTGVDLYWKGELVYAKQYKYNK